MGINLDRIELLAKMEKILDVPDCERLTAWYGDYSLYEPKPGVKQQDVDSRIKELDRRIVHEASISVEIKETRFRRIKVDNALSIGEAIDTVMEQYRDKKIVLNADDFKKVEFHEVTDSPYESVLEDVMAVAQQTEPGMER